MNVEYTSAFYDIVKDTQASTGYELPINLESYVVILLASYVNKPDYLPESTFAESYLTLQPSRAKDLGDTCLFVSGVFPTYGKKHGLNRRYYQDIGKGSYEMVAGVMHTDLFTQLSTHFEVLSEFIEYATHSTKQTHSNLFR